MDSYLSVVDEPYGVNGAYDTFKASRDRCRLGRRHHAEVLL